MQEEEEEVQTVVPRQWQGPRERKACDPRRLLSALFVILTLRNHPALRLVLFNLSAHNAQLAQKCVCVSSFGFCCRRLDCETPSVLLGMLNIPASLKQMQEAQTYEQMRRIRAPRHSQLQTAKLVDLWAVLANQTRGELTRSIPSRRVPANYLHTHRQTASETEAG